MAYIVGTAHTPFGKLRERTIHSLVADVVSEAITDAQIDPCEVDEIVVSHFNHGMDAQGFSAALPATQEPGFRGKPAIRVENACASGTAAVDLAARSIEAGRARLVLVVGVEKMTDASAETVRKALLSASYVPEEAGNDASFASLFAGIANVYFQRFGDHSDTLARIAAKNHQNGAHNQLAHMQRNLDLAFCQTVSEKNPLVAAPLRRTDCSMVSDGAAALVLADNSFENHNRARIKLRARSQVMDLMPMSNRDMSQLDGCATAWAHCLTNAGLILDDLDFVETHDCFTIAELMQYEAMGLRPAGKGAWALEEGDVYPDGKLPINLSGGLKAKGHPIGATGVSMHVLAARQLAERPVGLALNAPRLGGIFNMGGAGVANYCSILERID